MGLLSPRPAAQECRLRLLRRLPARRHLAETRRCLARPGPPLRGPGRAPQRRLHRHPERQDQRGGRPRRLRRQLVRHASSLRSGGIAATEGLASTSGRPVSLRRKKRRPTAVVSCRPSWMGRGDGSGGMRYGPGERPDLISSEPFHADSVPKRRQNGTPDASSWTISPCRRTGRRQGGKGTGRSLYFFPPGGSFPAGRDLLSATTGGCALLVQAAASLGVLTAPYPPHMPAALAKRLPVFRDPVRGHCEPLERAVKTFLSQCLRPGELHPACPAAASRSPGVGVPGTLWVHHTLVKVRSCTRAPGLPQGPRTRPAARTRRRRRTWPPRSTMLSASLRPLPTATRPAGRTTSATASRSPA